jgi:anti-sigma factor RsiW
MTRSELISDEEIEALIDGRLDPATRRALSARIAASPALAAEVEALRRQQAALRQIGQEVLWEPVPPHLRQILQGAAGSPNDGNRQRTARRQMRAFGLTAATGSLLAGCGSGFHF